MKERYVEALISKLDSWINKNGWAGYDPYDIMGLPLCIKLQRATSKTQIGLLFGKFAFYPIKHYPLASRKIFLVKKKINSKGMGLLVGAYSRLFEATNDKEYLLNARARADWLLENVSPNYPGLCWGYPFDWQSRVFIPKNTPSSVVTTAVGDGLWILGKITGEEKYKSACVRICEFLINGLNVTAIDNKTICYSYTPVDRFLVHNANLFSAEFLARIGRESGNEEWINLGIKAGNFALKEQKSDGSISYWGGNQNHSPPDHRDCYHSGFEIRCLWGLWKATGDERFKNAALRYLDFFYQAYIGSDGTVMTFPGKKYPLDIHSCAEAMLCPAVMSEVDYGRFKHNINNIIKKSAELMQNDNGSFAYMAYNPKRIDRTPYIRWGQAWMLRGLAEVLFVLKRDSKITIKM